MIQNTRLSKISKCDRHLKPLNAICIAPQCWNFRQLCQYCIRDDLHHAKMHHTRVQAFEYVQSQIDDLFKGLKALRKKIIQTMDTKVDSQIGMNEIQLKLNQIKQIFNKKIDSFHAELRKIYQKNVRQKLNQLFYIVQKSYQFLQEQKLKLFKTQKLRPFFVNDLNHDLKYYESYYEQILEKNIRRFKAGFQHDKVLKMMVSFQQNLSQIFKFQTTSPIININNHLLYANDKGHQMFRLKGNNLSKSDLNFITRQNFWVGIMPSVFYPPTDSYYLIGDGQRQSNKIRRINLNNQEIKDFSLKLKTNRMNFAICLFNHEIFIVGGENSKEGCLSKCQKFVPSEGKVYIVSSLNQRSAQHSLSVYKNKFILKFGGTDVMASILQAHTQRYHPLNPQIYSAETEDWQIVSFHSANNGYLLTRVNFGLWPGIFCSNSQDKVVILSGEQLSNNILKYRYDFQIQQTKENQIKQIAIQCYKTSIPSKNRILSECSSLQQDGKICFLVMDQQKGGVFFNATISKKASQYLT